MQQACFSSAAIPPDLSDVACLLLPHPAVSDDKERPFTTLAEECPPLREYGIKVLPQNDYLQGGAEFAKAVSADLEYANIFVQLLGPHRSLRPADLKDDDGVEPKSYAQFQYDAAKRRNIPIQWCAGHSVPRDPSLTR